MSRRTRTSILSSVSGIVVGLVLSGNALATPGMVISNQKISNTEGNFTAVLDNFDELGSDFGEYFPLDARQMETYPNNQAH